MTKGTAERNRLLVIVSMGVIFFCSMGVLLMFVLSTPPAPPGPPLYPEPPIYAGATEVEIKKGDAIERQPPLERERVITFKTGDTPQAVLSYYEETMKKAGWSLFVKIDPNMLDFFWTDGTLAGSLYKTNVRTKPTANGGTEVTLETGFDTGSSR
jgi:hypothetical protein